MIELTTGVVFLMSSLYGSGHSVTAVADNGQTASTTLAIVREIDMKDSKNIENYLKEQYADEPILVEIAWCESRYRQFSDDGTVIRGNVNREDVGVMQINEHFHADTAKKMKLDIYTVEGNVAFGKYLYDKYGTDPWSSSKKCWGSSDLALRSK